MMSTNTPQDSKIAGPVWGSVAFVIGVSTSFREDEEQ